VTSAGEGLEELARRSVDVVVTDLVMPEIDGRQFLQIVSERHPSLPVVLITSMGSDLIAAQTMEMGAVNYVPKRDLADNLVPVLEEILKSQREMAASRSVMRHARRSRSEFLIENDLEQIRSLVHLVRDRLHNLQRLSAETVLSLTAAVREALLNAYFHGNLEINESPLQNSREEYTQIAEQRKQDPRFAGRQISLKFEADMQQVIFRVADQGRGFDTAAMDTLSATESDWHKKGHGLPLIRSCTDSVAFNEAGNEITLTRNVDSSPLV
jgi:CheY-like chemotaxis protein